MHAIRSSQRLIVASLLIALMSLGHATTARAVTPLPDNPVSGSTGVQGKVSSPPPTQAATISTPSNGASYTTLPITVSGLCKTGLLIKIFDNEIFMGAAICENGSYSLQIDLFNGQNELVARVYDALDQVGPDSNRVTVRFTDSQFGAFANRVTLTSIYARRGVAPNQELSWPIVISGGTGPYAVSVDWGDGTTADLLSLQTAGTFTLKHIYKSAGQYRVIIKATDKNGTVAYLQLVGVANGTATNVATADTTNQTVLTKVIWWPALLIVPFTVTAFWLGKRHELFILRRNLERQSRTNV